MTGRAVVLRGDAAHLPLPDACVDLIVTSPPYFGLRSYTDGGEHYAGQIGSEATPAEFVAALAACTAEWVRVLKPAGSLFVNLGDKFSSGAGPQTGEKSPALRAGGGGHPAGPKWATVPRQAAAVGAPPKSLLGLPWRYALACMDDLGLILRRDVIWSKPNGLPESVTDRCRSSHEYVFHLVRQPRYYAAVDEIREAGTGRGAATWADRKAGGEPGRQGEQRITFPNGMAPSPLGKLPGSVWGIPSQPLMGPPYRLVWDGRTERWFATEADAWEHMRRLGGVWGRGERAAHRGRPSLRTEVDHFAAYPMDLPRRCILGWSPPGVCTACGEGRRPVTEYTGERGRHPGGGGTYRVMKIPGAKDTNLANAALRPRLVTGYACACPEPTAPTRPAVVLDPCGGTGTTAVVAAAYGRVGITVDRSQDYSRFARWRTSDPGQQAQAGQRVKPPPARPKLAAAGQGTLDALFGMDGAAS